jgi:ABC-type phosphate transport system substrate-binding protein
MASFRTALLATAATALSLAAAPGALAGPLSFTNYTTTSGLGSDFVFGVYASGSTIYAATFGGLSIAQQSDPTPSAVPGPLPLFGAASAFGFSRKLRRRLRAAATTSC